MSGLDGDDYATLASIEDHLRRIADALERAHPKFHPGGYVGGGYTIPEMPSCGYGRVVTRDAIRAELAGKPCDDRTCTDRDHWAPVARINHGSTPTTCVHGQDHPEALTCAYPCAATMPGHWCTRTEHADDRHVWAMSDEEAARHLREEDWFADPLDEGDHRARHDSDGRHWTWRQADMWCERACGCPSGAWKLPDADEKFGPLTFCDCDDVADADGATDRCGARRAGWLCRCRASPIATASLQMPLGRPKTAI